MRYLLIFLLLCSPVYAAKKKHEAPPPPPVAEKECTKIDFAIKDITDKKLSMDGKIQKLEGDEFAKFKAKIADSPVEALPDTVDQALVFKSNPHIAMIIIFSKGCYEGVAHIPTELMNQLLDDGSI